jgi:predicted transporter
MTRWLAYAAYVAGSGVFLVTAVLREAPAVALGSALFLLGTLLYLVPDVAAARRSGRDRADRR